MKTESTVFNTLEGQSVINPRYVVAINFQTDNLIPDASFEDKAAGNESYWQNPSAIKIYDNSGEDGSASLTMIANGTILDVNSSKYIPTENGEVFDVSFRVFVSSDFNGYMGVGTSTFDVNKANVFSYASILKSHTNLQLGEWQTITGQITVSNVDAAFIYLRTTVRETATTGYVIYDSVSFSRADKTKQHPTDGDITYLTSHDDCLLPDTDNSILNIDRIDSSIMNISGQSQKILPEDARHTIGNITLTLLDVNSELSQKIHTKLESGEGLRKKRVRVYKGHEDLTSFDDYSLRLTYLIDKVSYKDASYILGCSDIQRSSKTDIFEPHQATLDSTILAASLTIPISVGLADQFQLVKHDNIYSSNPNLTVGYIKIDDEIICHSGWSDEFYTHLDVVERGALGTIASKHEVTETENDKKKKIEEYFYLEMPVPKMIYAILTGELYGQSAQLPEHWHLAIDPSYVTLNDFLNIGIDLWDPASTDRATCGRLARFHGLESTEGKAFIEKELLLWLGAFMPVYSNGTYGLKRLNSVLPYSSFISTLDESQIVSYSDLVYEQASVINNISIKWNWIDTLERFTKVNGITDTNSISKHGLASLKTYEFKGVFTGLHSDQDLYNYFNQIRDRFASPPLKLKLNVLPQWDKLDVGDTVRVSCTQIHDYNANESLDRVFEVQQINTNWITGQVSLDLFGGVEPASQIPLDTSIALLDSFYTSNATDLSSVLTINSGVVTSNGDLPAGTYYYDGDLEIGYGIEVTYNGTVSLKIKGYFLVTGSLVGSFRGHPGGAVIEGANNLIGLPGVETGIGQSGYSLGVEAGSPGIYLKHRAGTHPAYTYTPLNLNTLTITNIDGTSLIGVPDDIAGSSGSAGDAATSNGIFWDDGGAGGASGAGLIIYSRGGDVGISGSIVSSGQSGSYGQSNTTFVSYRWYGGTGVRGSGGAVFWFIDGDGSRPSKSRISSTTGNATYTGGTDWIIDINDRTYNRYPQNIGTQVIVVDHVYKAVDQSSENVVIRGVPKPLNQFTHLPAQEEQEVTGYLNKPVDWDTLTDNAGTKPENNANLITATSQITDDANLGESAIWTGISGTGKPDDNANLITATSQITDDANLGDTAVWGSVSGTGKPEDNADVTDYAAAQTTAANYADAQLALEVTRADAYADGVVSTEEARAIQDATDKANAAEATAIAHVDSSVLTLSSNAYDGNDDGNAYATAHKVPYLVFQLSNGTNWPNAYGGVVTHWYDTQRATQICYVVSGSVNESEEYTREINPTSWPTWSDWKLKEIYKNADIDALQTLNAPLEAGATSGAIGLIPPNINGAAGATNIVFTKNKNVPFADNNGEINVSVGDYMLPDGTVRTTTYERLITTPWEGATVPPDNVFYVIWGVEDASTRFPTQNNVIGNASLEGIFHATYNRTTNVWTAHDNDAAGEDFVPLDTDYVMCVGYKATVTGGIDQLTQVVARVEDPNADVTDYAAAQTTAAAYADAQLALEVTRADAYADGVVSTEEARAIQDATDKAEAARVAAEAAAAIDASNKVDGIEVGSRNLLPISQQLTPYGASAVPTTVNDRYGNNSGYAFAVTDINSYQYRIAPFTEHDIGYYSLSFWAKADVSGPLGVDICDEATDSFTVETTWQHYKIESKYVDSTWLNNIYFGFVDFAADTAGTLYLDQIKLEKGTKATNWSPAPEDGIAYTEGWSNQNATIGATWSSDITGQPSDTDLLNANTTWTQIAGTTNAPANNATNGATWGSNISSQPADSVLLNSYQEWSDVNNSSEVLKQYNGDDLAVANKEYFISCEVDNNQGSTGWYKVASFTLVNNYTAWSFAGTVNWGSSAGRYYNSARVSTGGIVSYGSPLGLSPQLFTVSSDDQAAFNTKFKLYRESIGNPINSYKWTLYAELQPWGAARIEGIWRKGSGTTAWIDDSQTPTASLGTTYSPAGTLLTPDFNYTPGADITSDNTAAGIAAQGALATLNSVDTAQIVDDAITNAKLGALSVNTTEIVNDAITNAKIGLAAVDTAEIAASAVTATQIENLAVTNGKIANLAVTNGKIGALAVDTAQIQSSAITNAKIANLAVDGAKIATASINTAHIDYLSADKITTGTLTGQTITGGLIRTASSGQRMQLNEATNEAEFYGDRGDGTVEQLATIGVSAANDYSVVRVGSMNSSRIGVNAESNYMAVRGSASGVGGYGGYFLGVNGSNAIHAGGGDKPLIHVAPFPEADCSGIEIELGNLSGYGKGTHMILTPHARLAAAPSNLDEPDGALVNNVSGNLYFKKAGIWGQMIVDEERIMGTTGYVKFSNGLQICWGTDTRNQDSAYNLTFANAFTTVYSAVATGHQANSTYTTAPNVVANTYIQIDRSDSISGDLRIDYIAIGYRA